MALSTSTGFIRPEVWAPIVQADIQGLIILRQFAQVFGQLEGQAGDTLNLVEFARLTEISSDNDEAVALTPELFTSDATPLTIVEGSKAATISWRAAKTAFGDPVGAAAAETARVIAARVDDKLRAAAEASIVATGQSASVAANISYGAVIDATEPFGDSVANGGVSLVIHSKQWRDLVKDADFARATRGDGNSGVGYVGTLGETIPVFVSDRVTVIAGTPDTYRALLFHGKPLVYAHKADIETATADDILARSTTVASTLYYCVGTGRPERVAALVTQ